MSDKIAPMRLVVLLTSVCIIVQISLAYIFLSADRYQRFDRVSEFFDSYFSGLSESVHELRYQKTLNFSGLKRLDEIILEPYLPMNQSNWYWNVHADSIKYSLLKNPLVKSAEVKRCSKLSWGCFAIKVSERDPALVVGVKDTPWIVGKDGAFVFPVSDPEALRASFKVDLNQLPIVDGLGKVVSSPEAFGGQARYVANVVSRLENELDLKVSRIRLRENGECKVFFKGFKFPVVFGSNNSKVPRVEIETKRLKVLLNKLKPHLDNVTNIDLAFDVLAVVRFNDVKQVPQFGQRQEAS